APLPIRRANFVHVHRALVALKLLGKHRPEARLQGRKQFLLLLLAHLLQHIFHLIFGLFQALQSLLLLLGGILRILLIQFLGGVLLQRNRPFHILLAGRGLLIGALLATLLAILFLAALLAAGLAALTAGLATTLFLIPLVLALVTLVAVALVPLLT